MWGVSSPGVLRAAFVLLVLSAMSFVLWDCTSLAGLSNGTPDAGYDGAVTDAVAEHPVALDGPALDGGSDATDAPTADAGSDSATWCTGQGTHTFCADFDEGALLTNWTGPYVTDGGSIGLDPTAYTSAPNSFRATSAALPDGGQAHAALVRDFTETPLAVHLAFDLRVDALSTTGAETEAAALVFLVPSGEQPYSMQLNLVESKTELGEQIPVDGGFTYIGHALSMSPPIGQWVRVTIDCLLAAPNRTVTVSLGGSVVLDHQPLDSRYIAGRAEFLIGDLYTPGPSSGTTVHYDNVIFDLTM
jgi:hypothetical protein